MSLRYKVLLILTAVVVLYVVSDNLIQRRLVSRSFVELELEEATKDLARALAGIEGDVEDLGRICGRLATWNEVVRLVELGDEHALASCRTLAGLEAGELDLFFICDARGTVLHGESWHPVTREAVTLHDFPDARLTPSNPMLRPNVDGAADQHREGLIDTRGHGLMIVSAHSIQRSAGAPVLGTLILGRFLSEHVVEELGRRTQVDFSLFPLVDELLPARERQLKDKITAAFETTFDSPPSGELFAYASLNDIDDNPVQIVRANLARSITERGSRAVLSALLSGIATALVILLVMLFVLRALVIQPLSELTQHAVAIGSTEDVSTRIDMRRADEIGVLSQEFDRMMDRLAASREQLVQTARMAGMSDVATGVLHNVGNVLNSVNVSTNIVHTKIGSLAVEDLDRILDVVDGHPGGLVGFATDDARAAHLLPFLHEVRDTLREQKAGIREELSSLTESVGYVIDLVRSQQSLAGRSGVTEPLSVATQLDAALNITTQSFAPSAQVRIVREYGSVPKVMVDRQKLLEILVNLIQNARQALDEVDMTDKQIVLRSRSAGDCVVIEVEDNGPGIAPENLARIFGHGFTTKRDGHGFGLHISANAATEMGGKLSARSDGPSRGATFALELPLAPARAQLAVARGVAA